MLNKMRLLTPGPTPLPERVRLALAQDMQHHRKPAFKTLLDRLQKNLGLLFGTEQPVIPIASSGTGAMTAAVCALFAPGEKVLVVEGGKFAERWTEICKTHGVIPVSLKVEWGKAVNPADVQAALDADKSLAGVLVQYSETSTAVQHDVKALGRITAPRDVLLVVDGISAVGISPCPMDTWRIDALLTGSQKGLMLPPGLSLLAFSEDAWKKAEKVGNRNFYFNLAQEKKELCKGQTCFTPAINLLVGLDEALVMFMEAGLETVFRKQWALRSMVQAGLTAAGFELFAANPADGAWGVTGVKIPAGVKAGALLAHAESAYNVFMAAGQDHLAESVVRIGHMGWVDWADIAAGLYAFIESFRHCGGHVGTRDYLEQAMRAYEEALREGYPKLD